jgi:formate-dependent nitrite reductase membrane component NrfD
MAEHFVHPPNWTWYITFYFFFAGLAGGSYVLATVLRLVGIPRDGVVVRIGYLVPLPLVIICAILLTIDLGKPLDFWHMLVNTTPGVGGLNFKYWSPMSLGVWGLTIFGVFTLLSFLESRGVVAERAGGNVVVIIGSLFGLFIASYTGVLLSVSNQPVWSDTYALGGLFLASGLSGSAALLTWLGRSAYPSTLAALAEADGYFAILEVLFIAAFFTTLDIAGTVAYELRPLWLIAWLLVLASLIPAIAGLFTHRTSMNAMGSQASISVARVSVTAPIIVLLGVLLMRIAVVFSAQF